MNLSNKKELPKDYDPFGNSFIICREFFDAGNIKDLIMIFKRSQICVSDTTPFFTYKLMVL